MSLSFNLSLLLRNSFHFLESNAYLSIVMLAIYFFKFSLFPLTAYLLEIPTLRRGFAFFYILLRNYYSCFLIILTKNLSDCDLNIFKKELQSSSYFVPMKISAIIFSMIAGPNKEASKGS